MLSATPLLTDGEAVGRPVAIASTLVVVTVLVGAVIAGFSRALSPGAAIPVTLLGMGVAGGIWALTMWQGIAAFRLARHVPTVLWLRDDANGPTVASLPSGRARLRLLRGDSVRLTVIARADRGHGRGRVSGKFAPTAVVLSTQEADLVEWLREPFLPRHDEQLRAALATVGVRVEPGPGDYFSDHWAPAAAMRDRDAPVRDDEAVAGGERAALIRGGSWMAAVWPQLFVVMFAVAGVSQVAQGLGSISGRARGGEVRIEANDAGPLLLGTVACAAAIAFQILFARLVWLHARGGPWLHGREVRGEPWLVGRSRYLASPVSLRLRPGTPLRVESVTTHQPGQLAGTVRDATTDVALVNGEQRALVSFPGWFTPGDLRRLASWCGAHGVEVTPRDEHLLPRRVDFYSPRLDRVF